MALGTCMATYCAQNTGARDADRLKRGYFIGTLSGCVYAVVIGAVLMFFGKSLTGLFVSDNIEEIKGLIDIYMKCVGSFFIPLNFIFIYRNGIQGMGYGLLPMIAGIAELVGRGIVAVIGAHIGSYLVVCLSHAAAWICAGTFLFVLYCVLIRKCEKEWK
jgi:Na+-driven multidrug efflux pump